MTNSDYTLIPFSEAVERLELGAHFGDHIFEHYGEDDRSVHYYAKNVVIEGDIDLDALFYSDVLARYLIIDDRNTIVGRRVNAAGWKDSSQVLADLRVSDWASEIRPEFRDEFFDSRGQVLCGSGNVDLVKALLAGREILRVRD